MRIRALAVVFAIATGCGDEEDSGSASTSTAPTAPRPPAAAKPAGPPGKQLPTRLRIEDRVQCPTPTDARKCEPNGAACGDGEYCLSAGAGHYCGPCPEREAIRHTFKPRDFQGADIRDPFQSFVINQPGIGTAADAQLSTERTPQCSRRDQMVASNYSFQTLKLVGIVAQGTQRKVLMMDAGNLGHIVKKGDCVGKEKALVKDIGAGYVTFVVDKGGDPVSATPREPEEHSMQLYPLQVSLSSPTDEEARVPAAPIVAPPTRAKPAPGGTTVRIEEPPPPPPPAPVAPPQTPTELRP